MKKASGILGVKADRCIITDLQVDADPKSTTSVAGMVLDNSADCVVDRLLHRNFQHFGFKICNGTAFSKMYSCTA
jgi:hypothetical protein